MKRSEKTFTCLIILSMLMLTSCLQKTTSTRNDSNSGSNNQTTPPNYNNGTPPPTGGGSGNDPDAPGVPDYGQETPYRTLSNIIVRGRAHPAPYTTQPFWSSQNTFFPPNDHIFTTDSRFNLRVVARSAQGVKTASDGSICTFQTAPYKKLQIDICVRADNGSCNVSNTHTFTNVGIDLATNKKSFTVPVTSNPLVIEVKDVQSDLSCEYYKSMGYTEAQIPAYCPFAPHWYTECARFDIQFATDSTMDLPN